MAIEEKKVNVGQPLHSIADVPVIFVDGGIGITSTRGIVRLHLFQDLIDSHKSTPQEPAVARKIAVTLVMSEKVASEIGDWMVKFVAHPTKEAKPS